MKLGIGRQSFGQHRAAPERLRQREITGVEPRAAECAAVVEPRQLVLRNAADQGIRRDDPRVARKQRLHLITSEEALGGRDSATVIDEAAGGAKFQVPGLVYGSSGRRQIVALGHLQEAPGVCDIDDVFVEVEQAVRQRGAEFTAIGCREGVLAGALGAAEIKAQTRRSSNSASTAPGTPDDCWCPPSSAAP